MNPPNPPKRRGCLFYGIITSIVLLVLFLLLIVAGLYYVRNLVDRYTDSGPVALPKTELSDSQVAAVQQRIARFRVALEYGTNLHTLTISGNEINGLIQRNPDFGALKDHVYIRIEDGKLHAQFSIPLNQTGMNRLKDRWLNGEGTFEMHLVDGVLDVDAEKLLVKGKPLPKKFTERLARDLKRHSYENAALENIEDIKFEGNSVSIVPLKE